MAYNINFQDQMRRFGVSNLFNINESQANAMGLDLWRQVGLLSDNWRYAQGQSTADYANQKSSQLRQYAGYYDNNRYTQLVAGLGATSSDTILKRISALQADNSRFYNLMGDYNQFANWYRGIGGINMVDDKGLTLDMGAQGSSLSENRIQEMWLSMQSGGTALNQESRNLSNELTAQFGREQTFLSGVTGLTQSATQAKMAAEQKAAQDKLNQQYAAGQAQLNQQAAKNQQQLAAQQAAQDKAYAEAQAAAEKAAQEQQQMLNETAEATALQNASTSAKQQASLAVQNLETRATTLQAGPTVQTATASTAKAAKNNSRTQRWLATRTPAAGGGGANI